MVAGTVPWLFAVATMAAAVLLVTLVGWVSDFGFGRSLLAGVLAMGAADLLLRRCRARFGGITGDVLGALVETATTVALVVLSTS
jgi:adenosylcobinamide-GDP ribazoletransferase